MKSSRRGVRSEGRKLTFNFVYPNLYLVSDTGESVLLTHGHYFEAYWALASDWLMPIAADALAVETAGQLNLQELVGMNLPLNQLARSGIGQAEPLTALVRRLQRDVESGRLHDVTRFLDRLEARILRDRANTSRIRRAAERYVVRRIKPWLLAWLGNHPQARYSRLFLSRPSVRDRFRRYYRHSLNELSQLFREHGIHVPAPSHVVFGHTHQPIPWGADELVDDIDGNSVRFCNTGGWLLKEDADGEFVGAEVVVYESGRGFTSQSVRSQDLAQPPALAEAL